MGIEPMTSAIPVQRSNQLSYQANSVRAGQLRVRIHPVDGEMNMNIRNNHIFELRIKIELYEDHRSEGVST